MMLQFSVIFKHIKAPLLILKICNLSVVRFALKIHFIRCSMLPDINGLNIHTHIGKSQIYLIILSIRKGKLVFYILKT